MRHKKEVLDRHFPVKKFHNDSKVDDFQVQAERHMVMLIEFSEKVATKFGSDSFEYQEVQHLIEKQHQRIDLLRLR